MKKVYVTGMGAVSSMGVGADALFAGLLEGRSGVRSYPEWKQHVGLFSHLGAPAPEYDISRIPRAARRTMSRMSEMAVLATIEALGQADLRVGAGESTPRVLLCMGSTSGSPETLETYFKKLIERGGPEGQMGTTFFKVMNHSVPANVASALGFLGPSLSASAACATSAQNMILGWELLQAGLFDIVIAGGADELHYTSAAVFDTVQAASRGYNDRPDEASRPFDRDRDGLVVSEGAGVVVLETEESVHRRNAKPYARLASGSYLCNGSHMSQSNAEAMMEVMGASLERAGLRCEEIGYVNAHATSTRHGDQEEAEAIGRLFGLSVPVSSLKGHLGHTMAACGALEAIASIKMMDRGMLIPTRNLHNVDPGCGQVQHVQEIRSQKVQHVLSNNFAFGGMNTSLIVSSLSGG
jgi:3-oxoacyl-[acyl-carrier-protein] synthase II